MMDNPDNPDQSVAEGALSLFGGEITDDTLAAHLKTLRGDPNWGVFVLEGPKVRDVKLIYTLTNAWYALRLTKVRCSRGAVWWRA